MRKTRAILSTAVSLTLFVGGIFILTLKIPVWSLFLGLPAVQIGIILIIFTFDRLSQQEAEGELQNLRTQRVKANF